MRPGSALRRAAEISAVAAADLVHAVRGDGAVQHAFSLTTTPPVTSPGAFEHPLFITAARPNGRWPRNRMRGMSEVWIVYHDSTPDNNILGVFDSLDDADSYAEEIGPMWEKGALVSRFPVPWRSTDKAVTIDISEQRTPLG